MLAHHLTAMLAASYTGLAAMPSSSSSSHSHRRAVSTPRLALAEECDGEVLPQEYFSEIDYVDSEVPWDLHGRPQPCVRNAAQDGAFGKPGTVILDCGCGAGDNANWLAARGFNVLGFDISESGLEAARARCAEEDTASAIADAGGAVEFTTASCVDLASAERVQARARELGGFEVALDSALLHCLDDEAQQAYADGLLPLVRPGGKLYVGCFSDANPDPWKNPRRISEARLRELFNSAAGWDMVEVKEAWYERPAAVARGQAGLSRSGGAWTMAWWCTIERRVTP